MQNISRFLTAPLLSIVLAAPAMAAPALWKISDEDSAVWVFGSFHLLPPTLEWRTELFETALAEADKIYFETDIGPEAQAALTAQSFMLGYNLDGTMLSDLLNRKEMLALREAAEEVAVPVPLLLTMKPWMATNTISVSAMVAAGYDPSSGVDYLLQTELPSDRKGYFETGQQQLDFLGSAPLEEQIAMLNSTIKELPVLETVLGDMLDAWAEGKPDTIDELFLAEMSGHEEGFIERLIYERNMNWIPPISAMLAENEQSLIVVGTGHLVGERSVIDLLDQAGFTVERVQ